MHGAAPAFAVQQTPASDTLCTTCTSSLAASRALLLLVRLADIDSCCYIRFRPDGLLPPVANKNDDCQLLTGPEKL
jgi:hypothetical protein